MSEQIKFFKNDAFLNIKASFLDDRIVLSEQEKKMKMRFRHIHSLRLENKYSRQQAIEIHRREMGVSQSTAYRDYALSMQILGDLDMTDKRAERLLAAEDVFEIYQKAMKQNQLELALKARTAYNRIIGLEEKEQPIDPNKIQAHEYHIHLSRKASQLLQKTLDTGVVDFNALEAEDETVEE